MVTMTRLGLCSEHKGTDKCRHCILPRSNKDSEVIA